MFFNSIGFLLFLPFVFGVYWSLLRKALPLQNAFLLAASYFFYACWDWRFLFLLLFSTVLDYYTGLRMHQARTQASKTFWFWLSIGVNISFLGVFKYYDFFATSFQALMGNTGLKVDVVTLSLVLPVGISFYTFHGLSYVIDIYNNRIEPERNPITYALFVTYFPLLVAGPIERATHLLPQIKLKRQFSYALAVEGVQQIVWGLFKKVVVADNCAFFVDEIFKNSDSLSGLELLFGMFLFSFQIYGDFSGYSDIALGTSKLFGIQLLKNFNFPYFAIDIADFWRKWHISLSSWFRDYVYIPLGGSHGTRMQQLRNVLVIFLLSGLWHGANWTFIAWGMVHVLLFIPLLLLQRNRNSVHKMGYRWSDGFRMLNTFVLVSIAWVFFRADSLTDAFHYLTRMMHLYPFDIDFFLKNAKYTLLTGITVLAILYLLLQEGYWVFKKQSQPLFSPRLTLWVIVMLFAMGTYRNQMSFIYFQF